MKDVAYIALGSNVGDRTGWLALARERLAAMPRTSLLGASTVEETDAIGPVDQGPFLNQMIAIETELSPRELLVHLHDIERTAGRERRVRWGPRTLDLDIVLFERQALDEPGLVVPHPELGRRDFWMRELAELRARRGAAEAR